MDLQLESLKTSSRCHFSLCRWVETGACWEASCLCCYPFLQFAMAVLPGGLFNNCTMHTTGPVGPASTSSSSVRGHYFELAGSHMQEQTPAAQGRKVRQCCKSKVCSWATECPGGSCSLAKSHPWLSPLRPGEGGTWPGCGRRHE